MATKFIKDGSIKYLNRDYQGFKRDLIDFSQAHHSGVFQDYNESSPGMAILELQAYIGDVLSFYQDMQFLELKQESAKQIENVVSFAKQLGYRPSGKRAANGVQTFFIEVPSAVVNGRYVPDDSYTPILRSGAKVQGPNGVLLESLDDVIFSASAATYGTDALLMVTGSRFNETTGVPTHFALRKNVRVIAGETKIDEVVVGSFVQFKTIELSNEDVVEVLSVFDSDGNEWVEVDYLARETVFESSDNQASDSNIVPYVIKIRSVPRRFITDRNPTTNKTSLIFGSGDGVDFDDDIVPNLADMSLPLPGKNTFPSFAIDPQNFLKTMSLGLSPFGTTLTITYRVGGGSHTNVPAGSIKSIVEAELDFASTSLNAAAKGDVVGSLECMNLRRTEGGGAQESVSEIKANSSAFFAAQNRVVTKEDYITRIMSLPSKFGKPEKVYVKRNKGSQRALDIHILAIDPDGHLTQATSTLKENIRTYLSLFRMLTDGVNLMQTDIINFGVDFGIVVSPKYNRTEVMSKCLSTLRDYFSVPNTQIVQPIILSDVNSELQRIDGVISVYKLTFKNMFGSQGSAITYSDVRFDMHASIQNGILYCPENAIFEIKFPTRDITGESK